MGKSIQYYGVLVWFGANKIPKVNNREQDIAESRNARIPENERDCYPSQIPWSNPKPTSTTPTISMGCWSFRIFLWIHSCTHLPIGTPALENTWDSKTKCCSSTYGKEASDTAAALCQALGPEKVWQRDGRGWTWQLSELEKEFVIGFLRGGGWWFPQILP